ncbi:MAG: ISAs1 family transposase [Spirochaetaceae bacterium]|jgi:predicted transposase YbfD/YdcC|nr:ISAs1 family transposase [Spirochaetaceae bacterium]
MSCRTEIARKIREKGADYILALKEKQKTLYHNTKDYFEGTGSVEIDELPEDLWQGEEEKGHERKERREVRTVTDIERPGNKAARQDVKTLIQYRTFRTVGGKGTVQTDRYYISSVYFGAEEFLKYIRGHRSIENQPHWMADIVFREDECRVRSGNAALNMNILRKTGLYRLKKTATGKKRVSAKRRMMHAALNEDFLYQALFTD